MNTVTPQPAPNGKAPEFGFWEVETASLRDHPQTFRTFQIVRNDNNTVSIFVTNVDPAVQGTGSPADKSRGYSIGAIRISEGTPGLTSTAPVVYNGELIKPLPAPYTLAVNVSGPGTVKLGPYQPATCTAASPCSAAYLPGTSVTLTPTPAQGAVFTGWSTCGGTSTCNMTMADNMTVTATFAQAPISAVTPACKNFGKVKIGQKAIANFTVRNTAKKGGANLTIGTASLIGEGSGQFQRVAAKDRCSGQVLAPGKTCSFQVSFAPTSTSAKEAAIAVPSQNANSSLNIPVTGAGK